MYRFCSHQYDQDIEQIHLHPPQTFSLCWPFIDPPPAPTVPLEATNLLSTPVVCLWEHVTKMEPNSIYTFKTDFFHLV